MLSRNRCPRPCADVGSEERRFSTRTQLSDCCDIFRYAIEHDRPNASYMPSIRSGHVTAFFLYDVAEAINLQKVPTLIDRTVAARLAPKPTTPPYVQYKVPPLSTGGEVVGVPEIDGFRVRIKILDYGVISLALTQRLPTSWNDLLACGLQWHDDPRMAANTEAFCRQLVDRLAPAI